VVAGVDANAPSIPSESVSQVLDTFRGVIAAGARRVTDEMFVAAARALSDIAPALIDPRAPLLPSLQDVRQVSRRVALAVAAAAQRAGLAEALMADELERSVDAAMWAPRYARLKRAR